MTTPSPSSPVPPLGTPPGVPPQGGPVSPWAGQPGGWVPPPPAGAWRPGLGPLAPNGQPLAGFGDRLLAFIIDSLVVGAIGMVFTVPLMIFWITSMTGWMDEQMQAQYADPGYRFDQSGFWEVWLAGLGFFLGVILVNIVLSYLYLVEYQLRRGGETVGKRVMKLRVVRVEPQAALTRGDLTKRWAVERLVGFLVPMFSYLDGFWQLWDKPLQQCLHDKAAKTVVVKVG